jgi:hypothetical protein
LESGFYTPGVEASFTQGTDTHTFNAGAHTFPTLSYTAPSIDAGFWTKGTAAQFSQGTDTFNPGSCVIDQTADVWVAPSFTQGKDVYVAPTHAADTYNAGTHTQVTLPTFTTVNNLWNSATASGVTELPYQPEQA